MKVTKKTKRKIAKNLTRVTAGKTAILCRAAEKIAETVPWRQEANEPQIFVTDFSEDLSTW